MAELQCLKYDQVKCASLSFIWKIRNFSSCARDVGHLVTMDEVSVTPGNKIKCYLTAYPKGEDKESENYLSMFLNLTTSNNYLFVVVSFKVSVIDSKSMLHQVKPQLTALFTKKSWTHGWMKFIKTGDLLNKNDGLLLNDTLRIHCDINISTDVQECSLREDFSDLFVKELFSDVTIQTQGKQFKVHKSILAARSSTFAAVLSKETNQEKNVIYIPEIDKNTMNSMLHYIYSGQYPVDTSFDSVCKLLAAAEKFDLAGLKAMCEKILCTRLRTTNVLDLLVLANLHNASQLKESALQYVKSHIIDVKKKRNWKSFVENEPCLVIEVGCCIHSPNKQAKYDV